MTPDERAAHLRAIAGKGGRSTYRRYGREHFVTIGKRGFAVALELGWGDWLWRTKFNLTYEAIVGHPRPTERSERTRASQRKRAEARRLYPQLGRCAWPGCTAQAEQRHHLKGVQVPDANDHVVGYCAAHHKQVERDKRRHTCAARDTHDGHPMKVTDEKEMTQ
jgi:hypothetical protein